MFSVGDLVGVDTQPHRLMQVALGLGLGTKRTRFYVATALIQTKINWKVGEQS